MSVPEILVDQPRAVLKVEILVPTELADTKERELHTLVFCEVVGVCQTDAINTGNLRVGSDQRCGFGESVCRQVMRLRARRERVATDLNGQIHDRERNCERGDDPGNRGKSIPCHDFALAAERNVEPHLTATDRSGSAGRKAVKCRPPTRC